MSVKLITLDDVPDVPNADSNGHPPTTHTWQPASLVTLAANPPAPPTIGGLLYPAARTVLSGETESMKTWLALILCKAELDEGLTVAWADLDAMGPGAMLERLTLLGVDEAVVHERFLYIRPSEILDPTKITELADTIHNHQIRLFVIDAFNPILNLHALDPNSVTDVETFWQKIADPIADAGAAPVLLDHVVKNPDNRGKYASGSERKASGAIVHLGFKLLEPLTKGGKGRTLLTVHKDRPGYLPRPTLGRLILTSNGTDIAYQLEPDKSHDEEGQFRPTVLMEKLSTYLQHHPGTATKNEVEHSVTGKAAAIRIALDTLVRDGYLKEDHGPNRARLYTHIRPYHEAEDIQTTGSSPVRPEFVPDLRSVTQAGSSPTPPHGGVGRTWTDPPTNSSSQVRPAPLIPEYEHAPIDPASIAWWLELQAGSEYATDPDDVPLK